MSGRHGPVTKISDVLDGGRLAETWLYQEAMLPAGIRFEIGLELFHPPDEMNVMVFSRGPGADFSERDRLVLRLLRPHLDAAVRSVMRPTLELTARELEVLALVRDGLSNSQVASRLKISVRTVAKHLEHIFTRSGALSRTQAVGICQHLLDSAPQH